MMKKIIIGSALFMGAINANAAPTFSMQEIPIFPVAMNNNGLVVGREYLNNTYDAAIWNSNTGAITILPSLPNTSSVYPNDINESGQVIGHIFGSYGISAVMWEDNKLTVLNDLPGDGYSRPTDINNLGQVIGVSGVPRTLTKWDGVNPIEIANPQTVYDAYLNDSGQIALSKPVDLNVWELGTHAFFKTSSGEIDLGTLGGRNSYANGLNENGWVTGVSETSLSISGRAFVWDGQIMEALAKIEGFGGGWTQANAINDNNIIVGFQDSPESSLTHAILWNGWKAHDLNDLLGNEHKLDGWVITDALDINNFGQILAVAYNTNTQLEGRLLLTPDSQVSPIPEPSTYAMLLAGLGLLGFVGRRKN